MTGAAVLAAAACTPVTTVPPAGAEEARATVARTDAVDADLAPGVDAVAALGVDLYRRAAANPGNQAISPWSVAVALAMTRQGAEGETRAQMDAVLRAGAGDALDRAMNRIDAELARRAGPRAYGERKADVTLATANQLFGQRGMTFGPPFLESLARSYGAGLRLVDYRDAAEAARAAINRWVAERTGGRIVDLLPPGSLDADTRLVLTNALYLKAPWLKPFSAVGDRPFTRPDGSTVTAPTMAGSGATLRSGPGWQAADIPYLGGELAMTVILPDDLARFEAALDPAAVRAAVSGPGEELTRLQLPRFSFRAARQLKEDLAALGMPRAFSDRAEFAPMTTDDQLFIDDAYHQVFLHVDEEGTEAAAATAMVMARTSARPNRELVVDKPFLFAIRDVPTGTVLFLGRVADPTAA